MENATDDGVGESTARMTSPGTPSPVRRRIEILFDPGPSVHVSIPVAVVGTLSLFIAVALAAAEPSGIRFAALDWQASRLVRWERAADLRLANRAAALEESLRALRREALLRGIAPEGALARTDCDGTPEAHLARHVTEMAQLSAALAEKHAGEQLPEGLLPSRSPIDLAGDIPIVESGWTPTAVGVSSRQGERSDPFSGEERDHKGIDLAAPVGTAVVAPAAGVVEWAGSVSPNDDHARSLLGNYIQIRHGGTGFTTLYAHLSRIAVKTGQLVHVGDRLGAVGTSGRSTAPHLHYQVMKDGEPVNPLSFIADVTLVKDGQSIWYAKREARR